MKARQLAEDLAILFKTQPHADVDAEHDVLYVGNYRPSELDPDDLEALVHRGWHEKAGSWAHFT